MSVNIMTVALAIFVVCAGCVLLRGVFRILLGCVVLGASAWVAFRSWQYAPELVRACCGQHLPWLANVLPWVAFVLTFILGRRILRTVTSPFRRDADAAPPPLTLGRLLAAAVFTLIPTCLVVTILAILIYHAGAVAEIQHSARTAKPSRTGDFMTSLKTSVEQAIPPAWLQLFDPLTDPSRVALAKLITAQAQNQRPLATDPQTGKPIPRAIIVDDPELQNLAREGRFATLLRSPLLTRALNDPKVQALLKHLQS